MQTLEFMHQMQGAKSMDAPRSGADMGARKSKAPSSFEPALRSAANQNKSQNKSSAPAKENTQRARTEDLAGAAVATPSNGPDNSAGAEKTELVSDDASANSSKVVQEGSKTSILDTEQPVDSGQLVKSLNAALQAVDQGAQNSAIVEQLQASLRNTLQVLEQSGAVEGEVLAVQLQNTVGLVGLRELQATLVAVLENAEDHTAVTARESASLQFGEVGKAASLQLGEEGKVASLQLGQEGKVASLQLGQEGKVASLQLGEEGKVPLLQALAALEQTMRQGASRTNGSNGISVVDHSDREVRITQPGVVEGFVVHSKDVNNGKATGNVDDPRFAELLNKPTFLSSLREQQNQQKRGVGETLVSEFSSELNQKGQTQTPVDHIATPRSVETQSPSANVSVAATLAATGNASDGLVEVFHPDFSTGVKGEGAHGTSVVPNTDPSFITLKNGETMPMARVVDQTIQHLNLHARGDSSIVTVRLHPEELGELNIRMVMEGDQLKLQIQAQNQQVREILEQNFPRLRTAMEDQGVTVEDFQVSLGSSGAEEQAHSQGDDNFSQHNRAVNAGRLTDHDPDPLEMSAPQHAVTPGAGGLSVHV